VVYDRQWYLANRKKILAYQKKWAKKNAKKVKRWKRLNYKKVKRWKRLNYMLKKQQRPMNIDEIEKQLKEKHDIKQLAEILAGLPKLRQEAIGSLPITVPAGVPSYVNLVMSQQVLRDELEGVFE
jgi:hypothetical protein